MFWNLIRRWAVMAVAVPLAAAGARKLSQRLEARRGPSSRAARALRRSADMLQARRSRRSRWGLRNR